MKKITYSILVAALTLVACKKTPEIIIPDDQKEKISFSMSDGSAQSMRAEGLTKAGFSGTYGSTGSQNTQILMHIESQKGTESKWRFTKTQAVAKPEASSAGYSDVEFPEAYRRFWDDAHGRNSLLSIYAVAIPNKSSISSSTATQNAVIEEGDLNNAASGVWGADLGTEPTHTIAWSVSKSQNATTLYTEDLVYSNNIQKDAARGKDGLYWFDYENNKWQPDGSANDITKTGEETHGNGRMQFRLSNTSDPSSAGKFDKGHLKFNHSLSRVTIKLIEGDGFDHKASSSDFIFTDATNKTINLYKMNYAGTLDLKMGTWGSTTAIEDETPVRIAPGDKTETEVSSVYTGSYQCTAQILPDYTLSNSETANVLDFTIDNNTYYIQNKMLWKALNDNKDSNGLGDATSYQMKQGKNYVFTITVDKKKIESVTATIVDWSDVQAANENINNTHVSFNTHLANASGDETVNESSPQGFHLFRLTQDLGSINTSTAPDAVKYRGTYNDEATSTWDGTNSKWYTNWYFEDNRTAYHFRAINTLACVGSTDNANHDATGSEEHKKQSNFDTTSESLYSESTPRNCTYFHMHNGTTTAADYHWGAPMVTTDGTKYYKYDTSNGFEGLLHKGITATESTINITQLHMMSQINVVVRTTDQCFGASGSETATSAGNAIALETTEDEITTQCEVTLTRLYDHGTVDMGTGLIKLDASNNADGHTNGIKPTEAMTKPGTGITSNGETGEALLTIDGKKYSTKKTGAYTFNVIPQSLKRGSDTDTAEDFYIGITIKTPDNNQYYVVKRLSEIKATFVGTSQNQTTSEIKYWYPNHKYTYTFTITKKGIEAITCTLAAWSDVTGENINIDLEN